MDADELANWQIDRSEWECAQFSLNKQVGELRDRLEDLSHQNGQLLAELGEQDVAVKEHVSRQRELEKSRNELVDKNLELETRNSRLHIEKGELEAAAAIARKEAQTALIETHALKDQLRELTLEKARLSQSVDAARNERQSIELERQKHTTERDVLIESKRWLINEVAQRDNRISSLRLELSNKELEGASERLHNESRVNFLNAHIERLNEKVEVLQDDNSELRRKMEVGEAAKSTEVSNLEEEIRCLQELQKILKNSLEETKEAADHFRDQLDAQEAVIAECREVLRENQHELREKDMQLGRMCAELVQNSQNSSKLSDEQPSLLLEQAARRLAESEQDNTNLRTTLEELVDAVNQNRPHLLASRENGKEAELTAQRDDARRELTQTRAELEKHQRDYNFTMRRNAELMYAVERQSKMDDPNWSDRDDEVLFVSCAALLQRNVELEADIENAKITAAQEAIDAQSEEMSRLRAELDVTRKAEEELRATLEHTTAALESLKERAEHFKELVRDSASSSQARLARLRAEEAVAARVVADATVERLREQTNELKADFKRRELELEERCRAHEASINSAAETSIRLTAMLDTQKANTAAMELEYKSAVREKEQVHEELRKVMVVNEEQERKLVELAKQTLEASDRAGILDVRVSELEDELQIARTEEKVLRTMISEQKTLLEKEEQLRTSVVEMSQILSKVEAEKADNWNTQLEMLRQDRDSHKATASRLNDQLTHTRNDSRLTEQRLERELQVARGLLKEKEEQLSSERSELSSLRAKVQLSDSDASDMTPEQLKREFVQLKHRMQFLENELDTANRKLLEADAARARMDAEHAGSASHCKELEEKWKETMQISQIEQTQLRNTVIALEERAEHVTDRLAYTRNELCELIDRYEALEHKADRETAELRRKLQMAALNANGVERELEVTISKLASAQNENSRNSTAQEQHNSIVGELEQRIAEIQGSHTRLQVELDRKILELATESNGKKEAEQSREHIEQQLQTTIQELEQLKEAASERQKEYEEKLTNLSHQYESVLSFSQDHSTSTIQSNVIDNFQSLLQCIRQSKEEASQRAKCAELDSRRLRAEIAEFEKGRSALLKKIRKLELEKLATNSSLIEKAQLIEKVESMTNVHRLNGKLEEQLTELREQVEELIAKNEDLRKKGQGQLAEHAKAKTEKTVKDLTTKLSQTRQLAIKYRDELAELKKSLKTSPARDPCARRLAEQSKTHAEQLAEKDSEISELTGQIEELQQEAMRTTLLEKRLKHMSQQLAELRQRHAESTDMEGAAPKKSPVKKSSKSPQKRSVAIEPLNATDTAPPIFVMSPSAQPISANDGLAEPRRKRTASEMENNMTKRARESSSETVMSSESLEHSEHTEHTVSDEDHDATIQPAQDDVIDVEEDAPKERVEESEEVLTENDSQPSVEDEEPEPTSDGAEDEAPGSEPNEANSIDEHNRRSSSVTTDALDGA